MRSSRIAAGVSIALAGVYGWWLAGLRPFTTTAYLAIAIPTAVLVAALRFPGRVGTPTGVHPMRARRPPGADSSFRWPSSSCSGLGSRSRGSPSADDRRWSRPSAPLSTTWSRWHFVRYLMILAWLAVGFLLARRSWRQVSADGG